MTWVIILLLILSASAAVGVRIDARTRRDKPAELSLAQQWRAMGGGYLPSSGPLGHIGATSGPQTTGSQRTTTVTPDQH
jgi:hypothetical protein